MSEMKINHEEFQKLIHGAKKKILRLHLHPEQIKKSIKDLIEFSEDDFSKFLFEDIDLLVNWALGKLPLVPPEEKGEAPEADTSPTNMNEPKEAEQR